MLSCVVRARDVDPLLLTWLRFLAVQDSIELHDAKKTYDRVFDPSSTQQEVFNYVAKPLVNGKGLRSITELEGKRVFKLGAVLLGQEIMNYVARGSCER